MRTEVVKIFVVGIVLGIAAGAIYISVRQAPQAAVVADPTPETTNILYPQGIAPFLDQ